MLDEKYVLDAIDELRKEVDELKGKKAAIEPSNVITPNSVVELKEKTFPPEVIEVWNELIAKNWNGYSADILQKEAVAAISKKMHCSKSKVFDNDYLEIESIFRKHGWKVTYDKPAYCESYEASFKFERKK